MSSHEQNIAGAPQRDPVNGTTFPIGGQTPGSTTWARMKAGMQVAMEAIFAVWSSGTDAPSGGRDGQWYLRHGSDSPGIYRRVGGSWTRLFSGGGGDGTDAVARAAVAALQTESRAGDDIQTIEVADLPALTGAVNAQANADTGLFIRFQAHVAPHANGTLAYVPPRSRAIETVAVIDPVTHAISLANLRAVRVNSKGFLEIALRTQASSDRPTLLVFESAVSGTYDNVPYSFTDGDVAWLRPRTTVATNLFNLHDSAARNALKTLNEYVGDSLDTTAMRVYQSNHLPGIVNTADLDGDYLAVFQDIDRAIDPRVAKDQIDNVRFFVTDKDGTGYQVHSMNWSYVAGSVVFPFNISPSEEGNSRLQAAIATTPGRIRFALAFYETNVQAGGFVRYDMPISAAFRASPSGTVSPEQIATAVANYLRDNPPTGTDSTARTAAAKAQGDATAAATAAAAAQSEVDTLETAVSALRVESRAGDDLQSIVVATATHLRSTLTAQSTAATALEIVFSADVVLDGTTFKNGDVVYVAPRSMGIENRFNVRQSSSAAGEADSDIGGAENLGAGNAWSAYDHNEDLDRERYYEFRFQAGTGQNRFMSSSRFKGSEFLDLTAQTDESTFTQGSENHVIGLSLPRPNIDGVRTLYIARSATARRILMRVNDDYNVIKLVKLGGIPGPQGKPGTAELNQAQQIALLRLIPEPAVISFVSADALSAAVRDIRLNIPNPELLTGDAWVEGETQGQPSLARTKWSSTTALLRLRLNEVTGDSVASSRISQSDFYLEIRLRIFDAANGGNEIERIGLNIPLVDQRSAGSADQTARNAAAAAQTTANTAISRADAARTVADAATTPAEATTIANTRAAARFTDAEKTKLGNLNVDPRDSSPAAAATVTLDADKNDLLTLTATRNFTFNITNGANGQMVLLRALQDATGSRVMTLHSSIVRDGRDAPVLSTAAGAHDNVLFMKRGTTWVFLGAILNG